VLRNYFAEDPNYFIIEVDLFQQAFLICMKEACRPLKKGGTDAEAKGQGAVQDRKKDGRRHGSVHAKKTNVCEENNA